MALHLLLLPPPANQRWVKELIIKFSKHMHAKEYKILAGDDQPGVQESQFPESPNCPYVCESLK
jgi:hypothetical protein